MAPNDLPMMDPTDSSPEYLLIRGDPVRHIRFGRNARFEISAPGFNREAIDVTVLGRCPVPASSRMLPRILKSPDLG